MGFGPAAPDTVGGTGGAGPRGPDTVDGTAGPCDPDPEAEGVPPAHLLLPGPPPREEADMASGTRGSTLSLPSYTSSDLSSVYCFKQLVL
jgi:hypothetical protein